MAKQIINLPGTRVDTLWITAENGMNENGDEYEKKQVIAPRTFEEAVTDQNGTTLKQKLATMQEEIDNITVGEFPNRISNNNDFIFSGTTTAKDIQFVNKLDDAFLITTPNEILVAVAPDRECMTFFRNIVFENEVTFNKNIFAPNIDTLSQEISNIKQEIAGVDLGKWDYNVPSGKVINFVNAGNEVTIGIDPNDNDLVVKVRDNDLIRFNNIGDQVEFYYWAKFIDGIGVDLDSWFYGRVVFEDGIDVTGTTIFRSVINANGGINAPNIASTAELMSLGKEITEQDLTTIENQQITTEQDISNIETQQMLTDMELMMIGGQVA